MADCDQDKTSEGGDRVAPRSGPTVRRRRLGAELRRLREAKGWTVEEAATVLRSTGARMSRMERGRLPFRAADVADLLTAYDVTDAAQREPLLALVRETREKGWWHAYGEIVPPWFQIFLGLQAEASTIATFQGSLVPGLLQTADYARAVTRAHTPEMADDELRRTVDLRLDRQKILDNDDSPQLWAILHEAAIRCVVGGPDVMRAQLAHLRDVSERPGVTIQVLPFATGAHAAMGTSFTMLGFQDAGGDPEMVYLETPTGSLYLERDTDIRKYRSWMDRLRADSYDERASRRMLATAMEGTT